MPYLSVAKCSTAVIRKELSRLGLSTTSTRKDSIDILTKKNIIVLDVDALPIKKIKASVPVVEKTHPLPIVADNFLNARNYVADQQVDRNLFDVFEVTTPSNFSPVPKDIIATDAAFSSLLIQQLEIGSKLIVNGYDILDEIKRIKQLRGLLLERFENIKASFDNIKGSVLSATNVNLPMYNIANDIAFESFYKTFELIGTQPPNTFEITDASFYGKIEDSTVNADMNFTITFLSDIRSDKFTIKLPYSYDTFNLDIIPVMVIVYFGYDGTEYRFKSTISHGYIHKDKPDQLVVYCSLFNDTINTKFQIDIALRYFCIIDNETISPFRFSSLHKKSIVTVYGNVEHQWSALDNRIELFTNIDISKPIDSQSDSIFIELPVPMADEPITQVVGYGAIHFTTKIQALNQFVYTTNTPLVFISNTDTSRLCLKSSLLTGFKSTENGLQTMKAAIHIIYLKTQTRDVIHSVNSGSVYYKPGDSVQLSWKTLNPVNPYYFEFITINTINVKNTLVGSQTNWSVEWTIPDTQTTNGLITLCIGMPEYLGAGETTTLDFDVANIDANVINETDVNILVTNVTNDGLTVTISPQTSEDIPHTVRLIATTELVTVFDQTVSTTFSEEIITNITGLMPSTTYNITVTFTDVLERNFVTHTIHSTLDEL